MKKAISIFLLLLFFVPPTFGHGIEKTEALLLEKGIVPSLKKHQADLGITTEEMQLFVYKNFEALELDIEIMIDMAFRKPVEQAVLESYLANQSNEYLQKLASFKQAITADRFEDYTYPSKL